MKKNKVKRDKTVFDDGRLYIVESSKDPRIEPQLRAHKRGQQKDHAIATGPMEKLTPLIESITRLHPA